MSIASKADTFGTFLRTLQSCDPQPRADEEVVLRVVAESGEAGLPRIVEASAIGMGRAIQALDKLHSLKLVQFKGDAETLVSITPSGEKMLGIEMHADMD